MLAPREPGGGEPCQLPHHRVGVVRAVDGRPATNVSAPTSAQRSTVSTDTPPSTWIHTSRFAADTSLRTAAIFGSTRSRNFCPPKPGSTVISSTMSTSPSIVAQASIGVAGFSATPARAPLARSSRASRTGACAASTWNVTDSAPASANPGAQRSGSAIIRWMSNGVATALWSDSTTGNPIVRLGTKWLSITSMWMKSALGIRPTSVARLAKSALRMLGVMRTVTATHSIERRRRALCAARRRTSRRCRAGEARAECTGRGRRRAPPAATPGRRAPRAHRRR